METAATRLKAGKDTEFVVEALRALIQSKRQSLRSISLALGEEESWLWGQLRRKGSLPLRTYLLVCHFLEVHPAKPFIEAVPGLSEYLVKPGGVDLVALQDSVKSDLEEMIRREVAKQVESERE